MRIPLQISYRGVRATRALEGVVRAQVDKLERHCPDLIACRVTIDEPHRSQRRGGHFSVRVDVSVPGRELVAARDPGADPRREDCHVAVRDAFRTVLRELDEHGDRRAAYRA